jgi:Spy/CpxP family protein refolding chaperone
MRKTIVAGALIALLTAGILGVSLSAAAEADESQFCSPPVVRMALTKLARLVVLKSELGITNEQRGKIKGIVKAHRDELTGAASDVMSKKKALREAILANNEDSIRSASTDLGKTIGNASVAFSKIVAQAKPVLTEEQIKKIHDFATGNEKLEKEWLTQIGK